MRGTAPVTAGVPVGGSTRRMRLAARMLAAAAARYDPVERELRGVAELVPPGGVCLDVGAKHGLYGLMMAVAAGDTGRVVAFEPQPRPRRLLRAAAWCLGARSLEVVAAAVAEAPGEGRLSVPVRRGHAVPGRAFLASGALGLGSNAEFGRHRELAVRTVTLDGWVEARGLERVDVVKIDVEGAEPRVLDGAAALLERWHPHLLLEVEDRHLERFGQDAETLFDRLGSLGYRASLWGEGRWTPVDAPVSGVRNYRFSPVAARAGGPPAPRTGRTPERASGEPLTVPGR